jgi:hypothetical protein
MQPHDGGMLVSLLTACSDEARAEEIECQESVCISSIKMTEQRKDLFGPRHSERTSVTHSRSRICAPPPAGCQILGGVKCSCRSSTTDRWSQPAGLLRISSIRAVINLTLARVILRRDSPPTFKTDHSPPPPHLFMGGQSRKHSH